MNKTPTSNAEPTNRTIYAGLMLALGLWGSVLAYGAYLRTDDPRKGWLVLGCELAFLGFWLFVLRKVAGRGYLRHQAESSPSSGNQVNNACRFAWWLSLGGMTVLVLLIAGLIDPATRLATVARVVIVTSGLVAAVASLIGLSNPQPSREKWMGFGALSLCFVGPIAWLLSLLL